VPWENGQPVDVAPPAVERADDPPIGLGDEDVGWAIGKGTPKVGGGVGDAGRGVCLPSEFQDGIHFFQAAVADGQVRHDRLHSELARGSLHPFGSAAINSFLADCHLLTAGPRPELPAKRVDVFQNSGHRVQLCFRDDLDAEANHWDLRRS